MGVIMFSVLAMVVSATVYQYCHSARAFAAVGDLIVTESPNWQSMVPEDKWTSATDHTLIPVRAADYKASQQSTYNVLKKEESSVSERLDMAAYFDAGTKNSTYAEKIYIADPVFQRYNSGAKLGQYKLDASGHKIPGRNCRTYDPLNAYGSTDAFITVTLSYELNDGTKITTPYKIPENNVCPYNATTNSLPTNTNKPNDTKNNDFFAGYPIPGFKSNNNLKMDPDTKLYKVNISIAYDANVPAGFTDKGILMRQQLVFRVKIPSKSCAVASCRRFIGMLAAADNPATEGSEPNFSTLSRLLDDVSNYSEIDRFYGAQKFEFGLPCSVATNTEKKVTVYDMDNNNMGGKFAHYYIESYDSTTSTWSKLPVSDYTKVTNGVLLAADTVYNYNYDADGDPLTPMVVKQGTMPAQTIRPSDGSGIASTVTIKMNPGVRYRLVVDPLWSNNLLTIGLPTDSIYGMMNCPAAAPTAACVNDSVPTGLAYGTKVRIRPAVRVANVVGPWPKASITLNFAITDPSGTRTAYTSLIYSGEGEGDSATLTATDGIELDVTKLGKYHFEWTLGGAVGVAMGLNCNVDSYAGEQPYFTVYGGDILAGISSSKWAAADDAGITSWNKDNTDSGGYAGAGTQLAAISSGSVSHFVSNYASLIGAPSDNPSSLVFANAGAVGSGQYGGGL